MAKQMTGSNTTPTHEQITRRAYEIYLERGCPEGRDLEHWLEAETQLGSAMAGNGNGGSHVEERRSQNSRSQTSRSQTRARK
jgi:hypothetical protein